jgi:hypothetical protein
MSHLGSGPLNVKQGRGRKLTFLIAFTTELFKMTPFYGRIHHGVVRGRLEVVFDSEVSAADGRCWELPGPEFANI